MRGGPTVGADRTERERGTKMTIQVVTPARAWPVSGRTNRRLAIVVVMSLVHLLAVFVDPPHALGGFDEVAVLGFDEGSGSVAFDSSGNGNDAALLGGAAYTPATADGSPFALVLDGSDDYADLGTLDVDGSGLSLVAWFNADTFGGGSRDPRIISKASGTAAKSHIFMLSPIAVGSDTRLRARVRTGGSTTTLIASTGSLSTGTWHHAALTYDGSQLRLYLDGVEVGARALSGPVDTDPSMGVAIGAQPPGAGPRFFAGAIDDARILKRALAATEVSQLANPGVQGSPSAADDLYQVAPDQTLQVAAPGVLLNDSDPDSDPITAVLETDVTAGSLSLQPDGSFAYTPDAGFTGTDSFAYRAADADGTSDPATVTIAVGDFTAEADFATHLAFDEGSGSVVFDSRFRRPWRPFHSCRGPGRRWSPGPARDHPGRRAGELVPK